MPIENPASYRERLGMARPHRYCAARL